MTKEEFNQFISFAVYGMCFMCKHVIKDDNNLDDCSEGWSGYDIPCLHFEVSDDAWLKWSVSDNCLLCEYHDEKYEGMHCHECGSDFKEKKNEHDTMV